MTLKEKKIPDKRIRLYPEELPKGERYVMGTAVCVTIAMWDIAYTLQAGSRIRLDISSSDFPQYHIHSNLAGLWSEQTRCQKANQQILLGKEYPSRISIPLWFA